MSFRVFRAFRGSSLSCFYLGRDVNGAVNQPRGGHARLMVLLEAKPTALPASERFRLASPAFLTPKFVSGWFPHPRPEGLQE
jgi:hypothetical protein